mmetsp:Transcript_26736/g.56013  ORF Transcript_26736/g.56013 Transcript_26736/m.56013 type:complete len:297 (-) Transcript_26736:146-1036(-)
MVRYSSIDVHRIVLHCMEYVGLATPCMARSVFLAHYVTSCLLACSRRKSIRVQYPTLFLLFSPYLYICMSSLPSLFVKKLSEDPRSRQSCRSSRDWSTRSKSWSWGEASPTPLPRPGASRSEPRCARTTWSTLPRRFWRMPKRRASRSSSPSTPSPPSRSPPAPCPGTTRPSLTWSPAVASTTTLWASTSAPRPASSSSRASRRPPRLFSTDPWVSLKSSPLTTAPRPWWTPWRKSPRTGPLPLWAAGTRWRPWRNSEKPMPCPTCPPVGVPPSSSWRATFCPVSWRLPITSRQQG